MVWAGAQAERSSAPRQALSPKVVSDYFESFVCEEKRCEPPRGQQHWRSSAREEQRERAAARVKEFVHGRPTHPDHVSHDWERSLHPLKSPPPEELSRSVSSLDADEKALSLPRLEDALSTRTPLRREQLRALGHNEPRLTSEARSRSEGRQRAMQVFGASVPEDVRRVSEAACGGQMRCQVLTSGSGGSVICLTERRVRSTSSDTRARVRGAGRATKQVTDALGSSWVFCTSPARTSSPKPQPRPRLRKEFVQEVGDCHGRVHVVAAATRGTLLGQAIRPSLFVV